MSSAFPERFAVVDFETTGLSIAQGAMPLEVGIVLLEAGEVVARYQSLMNPESTIPWEVQQLTGITPAMVKDAPPVKTVMAEAFRFTEGLPLVAHNAAFDQRFWRLSQSMCGLRDENDFLCTLMLCRRILPEQTSFKLAHLALHLDLPAAGRYHRALADAEVTAHLLQYLQKTLHRQFQLSEISEAMLRKMQGSSRHKLVQIMAQFSAVKLAR